MTPLIWPMDYQYGWDRIDHTTGDVVWVLCDSCKFVDAVRLAVAVIIGDLPDKKFHKAGLRLVCGWHLVRGINREITS